MSKLCCLEILIIEDEEGLCDMAEFVAADLGCKVQKAYTLREATAIFANNPKIHLGLFDYHLPDSNPDKGWDQEFLKAIEGKRDFEFLFVTGDMGMSLERAKELGAVDILFKPFTCEELQSLIVSFIQRKRLTFCERVDETCPATTH